MKASGISREGEYEALLVLRKQRMCVSPDKLTDEKKHGACRAVANGTPKSNEGGLAKAEFFTEPKNVCIAK